MSKMYAAMMVSKIGMWIEYSDKEYEEMYNTYNHLSEDYEGITREDFKKI
jgi:hypothetical protein